MSKLADKPWWCWFVLAGTFYISFTVDGYNFAFGILKIEIEAEHREVISKENISIIGGLVPALYCLLAPLAFALVAVFSVRSLTICGAILSSIGFLLAFANQFLQWGFALDLLSLGICQGLASALLYGPSINLIPTYFRVHRKGVATGVTTCGSPAGTIVYGHMMHVLIKHLGWRYSMLVFALCSGLITLAGLTFLPKKLDDEDQKPMKRLVSTCSITNQQPVLAQLGFNNDSSSKVGQDSTPALSPLLPADQKLEPPVDTRPVGQRLREECKHIFNRELFSETVFITLLIAMAFSILGYYVPTLLITEQAKDPRYGVSSNVQEYLIWLWGIANLLGRLFVGIIADLSYYTPWFSSLSLFCGGLIVSAICVTVFPHVMIYGDAAFISFVILYGFFSAPFITLRSTVVQDLYYDRKDQIASSFGWTLWAEGLVIVAEFWLATYLNAILPLWAYVYAAACFVLSALFLIVSIRHFLKMYSKKVADMVREQQLHPNCMP